MSVYGYCRVSTPRQVIQRQIENIRAYGGTDVVMYADTFTGTTSDRPQWNKLHKIATSGDTIIFDSVSRMSRNADEGVSLYMELYNKGISLVFLNEPHINTAVYQQAISNTIAETGNTIADMYIQTTNKVLMLLAEQQIRLAFEQAEKEVKDLQKRTKEGMKAKGAGAKIKLAKTGTHYDTEKSRKVKAVILEHCKEFGGTLKDKDCIKLAGCSVGTFYHYKKELIQQYLDDGGIVGQQKFEL